MQIQTDNDIRNTGVQCEKESIIKEITLITQKNYDPLKKIKEYQIIMIQRNIRRFLRRIEKNQRLRLERVKKSVIAIQRYYVAHKWKRVYSFIQKNKYRMN